MRNLILASMLMSSLTACAAVEKGLPGEQQGQCEKNPESCSSVRQAYRNSNGEQTPKPSDAALQRGDVMRVWVAPMRLPSGTLTNSGYAYLE